MTPMVLLETAPGNATTSRGRALLAPAVTALGVGAVILRLHQTNGIDVAPFALCPFHAVTGFWCPFCGGLRGVAALSHGDVAAALSSNLPAMLLLPFIAASWVIWVRAGWRRIPVRRLVVSRRQSTVLVVVFLVFTVWRNLPMLPLGAWLAP